MARYLLPVTFQGGADVPPMTEWKPEEVKAHLNYYIAAKVSAVPGVGGVPTRQPIQVRRVMDQAPSDAAEMDSYLRAGA